MKIRLNNMHFHSYIGYYSQERAMGQDISVSVELIIADRELSVYLADELENTVNYGEVYQIIEKVVHAGEETRLLETLAAQMIQQIHQQIPQSIELVTVQIKKMNLPIAGILDNAEIELAG